MPTKARGFTLIELMISLAIGLIILSAVVYIFLSNSQTYRLNEAQSRVQENGRFALEYLTREVRQAGFNPTIEFCGGVGENRGNPVNENFESASADIVSSQMRFMVNWSRPDDAALIESVINPFKIDNSGVVVESKNINTLNTVATALNPIAGSDVLEVTKPNSTRGLRWHGLTAHNSTSFTIDAPNILNDQLTNTNNAIDQGLLANSDLKNILIALDQDCTRGTVFSGEVSGGTVVFPTNSINDNSGNNSTRQMGFDYTGGRLVVAAELTSTNQLSTVRYFIAQPVGAEVPSLYRQFNNGNPQALVEGVNTFTVNTFQGTNNRGVTLTLNIVSQLRGFTESSHPQGRLQQTFETTVAVRNPI
ncbi:PilW family protein [Nitrincola nitratireducens]|uniref:Tfp pilus assembly protein PilW n=1 Tax=Nitrincola nitratireducens TaxID=1229521 RepID=W9UTE6_9GAMM|nr:prepilin-type N-terminal cleavage/methylation domain-containing protein [Nitrincola nitratireducens]EXJ10344.1 Tfp pilus assembly protein PilW [Nitrincola nitratireducens]